MQGLDRISALGLACAISIVCFGCGGGDDDSSPDSGVINGGTGGVSSGSGGTSSGSGGTMGGTGGTMGGTGGTTPMGPMCDTSVPATMTCGGTACTVPGAMPTLTCSVPCCLPDMTCGVKRAPMGMVGECVPVATPDPSCPDMMGAANMVGCCAPSGRCGVTSGADMTCITSSPFLPMLMPGAPCGGATDGGVDGGN